MRQVIVLKFRTVANDTRQKILNTARELFNERGLHRVGVRDIARAAGISPGNLSYHFATRDDLVAALVRELHEVNAETAFASLPEPFSLLTLYRTAIVVMRNILRYRFVLLSYVDAVRSSKDLQRFDASLSPKRRQRSDMMIALLVKGGFIHRRALAARFLAEQSAMISSGWLNAAALHPHARTDEETIFYYAKVGCALLEPYCTPKGARQMKRILAGDYDVA